MDRLAAMALFMPLIFQAAASQAATTDAPVVLLIQASGAVAYSSGDGPWKVVRRNKFLYRGYTLKTGPDGICKLLDPETDEIRTVENNTMVNIDKDGLKVVKGHISMPIPAGGIAGFLERKFTRVQKYAAVRRAVNRPPKSLKTAREITLSPEYPDLVWESWGPLYSYELTVGQKWFDVPPTKEEIVRFTLTGIPPGTHPYRVKVLYQGEILQRQKRDGTLRWLSEAEVQALEESRKQIEALALEDGFLLGNLMDDQGLKVAAMDIYQRFMAENPEANEIRPFLIKVLSDLHLDQLRQRESVKYHRLKERKD